MSFTGANNAAVNGYINDQNIVDRVETWIDNPVLGDTLFEACSSHWRAANPPPSPGGWAAIADPAARTETAAFTLLATISTVPGP